MDCLTPRGQTPLFLAVEEGLMENASFLLQRGAQANSQDQELESPLLTGRKEWLHKGLGLQFITITRASQEILMVFMQVFWVPQKARNNPLVDYYY